MKLFVCIKFKIKRRKTDIRRRTMEEQSDMNPSHLWESRKSLSLVQELLSSMEVFFIDKTLPSSPHKGPIY